MSDDWRQELPGGPEPGPAGPRGDGAGDGGPPPPPWEDRERYGRLAGFLETVPRLLFRPHAFFAGQPLERGVRDPLLFVVGVGVLSGLFLTLWLRLIPALQHEFLQIMAAGGDQQQAAAALEMLAGGPLLLIAPLAALINVLVTAGLYHLVLTLSSRPGAGFAGTLRVAAYGYGVNVWTIVPSCGGLLALAWSIPVSIIGLVQVHRIDPWRAALAVVLPPLVCGTLSVALLTAASHLAG